MSISHDDLKQALRVLVNEGLGDFTYTVRDRIDDPDWHESFWLHPRVVAFSEAATTVEQWLEEHGDPT